MGRITEAIAVINKEVMPGEMEYKHFFTHLNRDEALRLRKVNRIRKTEPKQGKYWCYGCDRAKVSKGQKCPVCGQRDISKHSKI